MPSQPNKLGRSDQARPNGAQLQFDRRVNILATHSAKILRDLARLRKRFPVAPGSQRVLETKHFSAEFQFEGPNDALDGMPKSMAKADFEQEYVCKFVAASGQCISVETFRKCLRDDRRIDPPGA